jgi:small subunit ribosomal protein S7
MAKKFKSTERFLKADHKYSDMLVTRFINRLMLKGKKLKAERIFYDALDILSSRLEGKDPLEVFTKAVENVKPVLEVRSKRVGGATYQVPVEVPAKRRQSLALRWIIGAAREKKGRRMAERLAQELMDAYNEEGSSIEKRDNVHAMAQANKAFAHFAW